MFSQALEAIQQEDITAKLNAVSAGQVEQVLAKRYFNPEDFLVLLSPAAEAYLEDMAQIAHDNTLRNFGKTVTLFKPLYLSNYCVNHCLYCGFALKNDIVRQKLTMEEIQGEAQALFDSGVRHVIALTGESEYHTPLDYLKKAIQIMKPYFNSLGIEVYPMSRAAYAALVEEGVDSLTIYQETYDKKAYAHVHPQGPKADFNNRVNAPDRAAQGGMKSISIGALLGLASVREDFYYTLCHAHYLEKTYPHLNLGISTPRIRPCAGTPIEILPVTDKNIVQFITAARIFFPKATIAMTTRERADFRDKLLPLGVNKLSAEVSVEVGGYRNPQVHASTEQFEINDDRSLARMVGDLKSLGYDPVFTDWV